MRAYLPEYEMLKPRDLADLLSRLQAEPGVWKPFAGGTDLMVLFEAGKLAHRKFLSIWHLAELKGIQVEDEHVTLGALTTYSEIQAHPVMQKEFPILCQAGRETGAVAIQNRGTIGGNIVNASPAADTPPGLLVHEAEVELVSTQGKRWVRYVDFHTGYKTTVMQSAEVLSRVRIPRSKSPWISFYRKVGTRKAQAISKVCFAGLIRLSGDTVEDVRIGLGSVAPTPIRCRKTEASLKGKTIDGLSLWDAQVELQTEIAPIDDIRSTQVYRAQVAENLLEEFLERCGTGSAN